jgi:gas vesicle protein
MREYDETPYIVIERRSSGIAPFFWGAILGAGAALLLAPRSGAETQEEIRQQVRRARTAAENRVENARMTVARTRDRIQDQIDTVRDQVGNVRNEIDARAMQAREALETGRRAAREARQELERRVADVRDTYYSRGTNAGYAAADSTDMYNTNRDDEVDVILTSDTSDELSEGRTDLG